MIQKYKFYIIIIKGISKIIARKNSSNKIIRIISSNYFIERELYLTSYKFYQILDNYDEDLGKYYQECNEFSKSKYRIKGICAQVLKYLETSAKKSDKENFDYDDCLLLNYWVYGRIYEKHGDKPESAQAFGKLQLLWNSLISNPLKKSYNDKCEPDFLMVMQPDWRKRKELYDYFVNYNMLQSMRHYFSTRCNKIYTYLKEKDKLYKEYKEYCSTPKHKYCPDFFTKFEDKDPNTLLNQLPCYGVMQSQEALTLKQDERPTTADKEGLPLNSQKARDGTNPVTNSGNVLLGVVLTSMTSGALYKVKTDFIITY
ncbi:hypothetical protein PVBG_05481 [Plasmodium vivax Brazil I]|uniref:Uncharacterized protein n=1 Tax=Plasmodium vivax (strain Brazil I) TaxID=1033975 RepID=A0A0J9SVE1_PLAV1|nr:hypothetical protein PVBG_05481 [Plasmodium vivax Brazil I]